MRKVGTPAATEQPVEKPTIQQEADADQAANTPASIAASIPAEEGASTFAIDRDDMRRSLGNDRRGYVWPLNSPDPRVYMGVTSALNAIPKQAIPYWAAKMVAETAVDNIETLTSLVKADRTGAIRWLKGSPWGVRDKAADIGTAIHTIAELDSIGESAAADTIWATLDETGKNKAKQVRAFFTEVPMNITYVEGVIYSDTYGYAGTLDFIVEITDEAIIKRFPIEPVDGKLTLLVDLKTSKGVYPETALQLAAYRFAEYYFNINTGERDEMPKTDGAAVLHVTEKSWSFIPMDSGDEAFGMFLAALDLSKYVPLGKEMVGIPSLKGSAPKPKPIPKVKPQTGASTDLRGL